MISIGLFDLIANASLKVREKSHIITVEEVYADFVK